jgi:hypothetical protein
LHDDQERIAYQPTCKKNGELEDDKLLGVLKSKNGELESQVLEYI